ncbi:hypothetical protein [Roseovarius mucosus]|uniref:hypothetical protein n=1 Tax=Roseovarius mucosus TaxID=215743 RepID=UPI003BA8C408
MGFIVIGAGIPILAALLFGRFNARTAPFVIAGVLLGPLALVIILLGFEFIIQWGAECRLEPSGALTCGEFLGQWPVNVRARGFVGTGYAAGFAILWATIGLVLLFAAGIATAIIRRFW